MSRRASVSRKAGRNRPLRVSMFAMMPEDNAGTRAFCERPARKLADLDIAARVFTPSSVRLYKRFDRQPRGVGKGLLALYWYGIVGPRRLIHVLRSLRDDILFVHRGLFRYGSPPVLEWLLRVGARIAGRRIVYHCDDALYEVASPRYFGMRCRMADLVLTGNPETAEAARRWNPKVMLLEAGVQVERYPQRKHGDRSPVVIGWVGRYADERVRPLLGVLRDVVRTSDALFAVVSDRPMTLDRAEPWLSWRRWDLDQEFEVFADFDIGILPLADTAYNRGKEAFKAKEYMAAALPVVCSPVGHNVRVVQHGETGFHARTEEDWRRYLLDLVADVRLRERLGTAGRKVAIERYSADQQASRMASYFRELIATAG